jgi:hypothetical protein
MAKLTEPTVIRAAAGKAGQAVVYRSIDNRR